MILDLLATTARKLEAIQVPYMLSGSIAMGFYTVSRSTRDIDIVAYLQEKDIEDLLNAFEGYYFHRPTVEDEVNRKGLFNIISNETGFKIDFIVLKPDEYSQVAFNRKKLLSLEDVLLYVIAIEDLIIAKLKWIQQLSSERQLTDIQNLLLNKTIDQTYLLYWKDKLKFNTFNLFLNDMELVYNFPTDTPPHIMETQVSIILQKSMLERLQMCADMTDFSLKVLKRHIKAEHPDILPARLKFEMIKLLYADCYNEEEMARIEQHFINLPETSRMPHGTVLF